jgi:hypothetical protein
LRSRQFDRYINNHVPVRTLLAYGEEVRPHRVPSQTPIWRKIIYVTRSRDRISAEIGNRKPIQPTLRAGSQGRDGERFTTLGRLMDLVRAAIVGG